MKHTVLLLQLLLFAVLIALFAHAIMEAMQSKVGSPEQHTAVTTQSSHKQTIFTR